MLRYPRTRQELERNSRPEEVCFARGRRRKRYLPTSWDDIFLPYRNHICWKKLRATQYKQGK